MQTDHKPFLTLYNEEKQIPQQASNEFRVVAWKLTAYDYTIEFLTSKQHANADALSTLSLTEAPEVASDHLEVVLMMENMDDSPVSAKDIASRIKCDHVLSREYQFTNVGLPATCGDHLKLYEVCKTKLTTQDGCVICRNRVVIPPTAQEAMRFQK